MCSSSVFLANCSVSQTCLSLPPESVAGSQLSASAYVRPDMSSEEIYEQIRLSRSVSQGTSGRRRHFRKSNSAGVLATRSITPESVLEAAEEEAAAAQEFDSGRSSTAATPAATAFYQNLPLSVAPGSTVATTPFRIQGVFSADAGHDRDTYQTSTQPASAAPIPPPRHSSYSDSGGPVNSTSDTGSDCGEVRQLLQCAQPVRQAVQRQVQPPVVPDWSALSHIREDEPAALQNSWPSNASVTSSTGRPDLIKTARGEVSVRAVSPLEEAPLETPRLFGLNQHHVLLCQRLLSEHPRWFEYTALLSGHYIKVRHMLNTLGQDAGLQILAQNVSIQEIDVMCRTISYAIDEILIFQLQLLFLVEEAWLSEPCIGAESLVDRVNSILTGGCGSTIS